MALSKSDFIATLANGRIYYFVNSRFASTDSHFHLCLHIRHDEDIFLLCGTSRPESTTRYLEYNNISYETFVAIRPNPRLNTLSKDTYFHCNEVFEFKGEELYQLYLNGDFIDRGTIEEYELLNIKNGISKSPILETNVINEILNSFPEF